MFKAYSWKPFHKAGITNFFFKIFHHFIHLCTTPRFGKIKFLKAKNVIENFKRKFFRFHPSLRRIADKRLLKSGYYSILKSAGNPPEMKCTPSDIEPYRIAKSWSRIGQFSLNKHAHWLKMWTLIPGAASEAGPGLCLWCGDWLSAK